MTRRIVHGAVMVAALVVGFVAARWWTGPARPRRQVAGHAAGMAGQPEQVGAAGGGRSDARARRPRLAMITPVRVQSAWDSYVLSDPERHMGQGSEIIQALVRSADDWLPAYMECADRLTDDQAQAPLRIELRVSLTADVIEVESGRVLTSESGTAIGEAARQCLSAALPHGLRIERARPAEIAPYRGPFEMVVPSTF